MQRRTTLTVLSVLAALFSPIATGPAGADAVRLERVAGSDRYATAVAVTARIPGPALVAFVASGTSLVDALSTAPAAARAKAPLLLVSRLGLPVGVTAELRRLATTRVVIAGGESAVSKEVAGRLAATGVTVQRLAGADRYATAATVSAATFPSGSTRTAYLVGGGAGADAAAAGPAAARRGAPVLLTESRRLPAVSITELRRMGATDVTIVGGSSVVSADVERQVETLGLRVRRIAGSDRYATAAAVALDGARAAQTGDRTVYLASGLGIADAIAGGAAAGAEGAPLLMVPPATGSPALPEPVASALTRVRPTRLVVLGGTSAVSDAMAAAATRAVDAVPLPNLLVTDARVPDQVTGGGLLTADVTVANRGSAPAPASQLVVLLSDDRARGATDQELGSVDLPRLEPGAAAPVAVTGRVPDGIEGPRFVLACVDAAGTVTESDEADNCAVSLITVHQTFTGVPAPGGSGPITPPASAGPSAQALLAAALSSGAIDPTTWLSYRAMAMLDESWLPPQYLGSGSTFSDSSIWAEIADALPGSTPAQQLVLSPFLMRPADAGSHFGPATGSVAGAGIAAEPGGARLRSCERPWIHSDATTPFKVWVCPTTPAQDQADIASMLATLGRYTPKMHVDLGAPKGDGNASHYGDGGDGRIDVYLAELGQRPPREGADEFKSRGVLATAVRESVSGGTASGFMVVNRALMGASDDFEQTVIHEYFHLQQYNRNALLGGADAHWFVEASAEWAATYYYLGPARSIHDYEFLGVGRSTDGCPGSRPCQGFLGTDKSLQTPLSPSDSHPYAAYIWPHFIEEDLDASAVFFVWKNLMPGRNKAGATSAVNAVYPFDTRFRDFALRNLNLPLDLPAPDNRTHAVKDPSFPVGVAPRIMKKVALAPGVPYRDVDDLPSLSAHYYEFTAEEPVRLIEMHLDGTGAPASTSVDLLVKIHDLPGWERRRITDLSAPIEFCRNDPAENVEKLYLIVSNHDMTPSTTLPGEVKVRAEHDCGAGHLEGQIRTLAVQRSPYNAEIRLATDWDLKLRWDPNEPDYGRPGSPLGKWVDDGSTWSATGTQVGDTLPDGRAQCNGTFSGSGTGFHQALSYLPGQAATDPASMNGYWNPHPGVHRSGNCPSNNVDTYWNGCPTYGGTTIPGVVTDGGGQRSIAFDCAGTYATPHSVGISSQTATIATHTDFTYEVHGTLRVTG